MKAVSISSILSEGMIVNTKVGSGTIWYQNIVYKCTENQISLALIHSYLENIVLPGSSIYIKYANENFEYLFECIVISINAEFPGYVTLRISKSEEMINTREFPRYDLYLASEVKADLSDAASFSIVVNICLGGMAFLSKHDFDYGEELLIRVYLPENKTIDAKGKTIRKIVKGDYINYSMQFTEMTEESSILLSDYLSFLDDMQVNLKNNYFNVIKPNF